MWSTMQVCKLQYSVALGSRDRRINQSSRCGSRGFLKLGALRLLLRPYLYSNLYLDSMPLEYPARVFLEHRSPCSGIAEPSLHVFQRRGMVRKVSKRSPYQTV